MIIRFLLIFAFCLSGNIGWAQFQTFRTGNILVLDQPSLLTRSNLGQAILQLEESEQAEIVEQGRQTTLMFEAEEASLTEQRLILSNDEFRVLADAFNDKVEAARTAQSAMDEAHITRTEARRRAFFQFIVPQLGEIIQKYGAAAIIDRRNVLLFDKNLDITLETIALLDKAYEENPDMIDLGN